MTQVLIFDTTLRDGEQSPGATMTPPEKLRLAHQLDALGVDVIEAGFPISSPDNFAGVQQIAREVRRPVIAALARAGDADVDRAAKALEGAERGRLHVFIATSDIHLKYKIGISRAECLERAVAAVERARGYADDVEFSAEDATRTDLDFLCEIFQAVIAAGASTVNAPDTVGYTHPAEYRAMVEALLARVKGIEGAVVSAHCHDDLGLAVANSLAALEAGARQVECTINGIGERAGNAALEEIVMALRVRGDAYPYRTGVNTEEIYRTSQLLTHLTGMHPQANKAVVGKNAFAHEAGIHQDGVIKNPLTYEIMTPQMVGVPTNLLVLGKHSGRNALSRRYKELGYELDADGVDRAYGFFKLLCDRKKTVLDEDLIAILHHGTMEDVPHRFHLRELHVVCGTRRSEARVRITEDDRERDAAAEGDGPLAAAFSALDALVPFRVELEELEVHSATPGGDAVGEVSLRMRIDGKVFTGRSASTDVVDAGVRAYLNALNKAAQVQAIEARALEDASYLWGV
ncbi:MAG TPA: 2-isopropylmalate synthase [Longimicrobiaceae bacterium]|nr:2-isopropylmalate synthase [Longimicrobiaceae bacterium]